MRSYPRVLLFAFAFLLAFSSSLFAQNPEALKHARSAFDFEQQGKFQEALYEYNAAALADPKYPYPLTRIGGMYQTLKNYPLAIQYYERSVKLDSAYDVYNYFNLGLSFRIVQKYDSAVTSMREFLKRMEPVNAADTAAMKDADFWIAFDLGCIAEQAKPKNTSPPIPLVELNSTFDDFAPSVTADGQTMYFTSRRPGTQKSEAIETEDYGDDIFVSHKDTAGHWVKPVPLPPPLNSVDDEGAASVSADGQTLYYSLCRRPDGVGDCDLYMSELSGEEWTRPQNLGRNINSQWWDAQPSITADGSTMYFSSRRAGSIDGSEDIYYSYRTQGGAWTKPVNLGTPVNTRFSERSPFISADGKTLYFASNGHPGWGNHDLFMTRKLDDGTWSVPVNLGSPINAYGDDDFLTIPASGDRIYYSSQRANARGDLNIYQASLPAAFRPGPVTVVAGTVYDSITKVPIAAKIEVNDLKADQLTAVYRANKVTGKFYITLGTGKTYGITAQAPGYAFYSASYTVPDTIPYRELTHDIAMQAIPGAIASTVDSSHKIAMNNGNEKQPSNPKVENPGGNKTPSGNKNPGANKNPGEIKTPGNKEPKSPGNKQPKTPGNKLPKTPGNKEPKNPGINQPSGTENTGPAIELHNLFFDFNKATLRPESRTELRYLIALLKENPKTRIEISGHTDSVGTPAFNQRLSLDRAEAVRSYLAQNGIDASRLVAKGYGASQPKASNATDEGRQQNRRTEFRFITATKK